MESALADDGSGVKKLIMMTSNERWQLSKRSITTDLSLDFACAADTMKRTALK